MYKDGSRLVQLLKTNYGLTVEAFEESLKEGAGATTATEAGDRVGDSEGEESAEHGISDS